MWSLRKFHSQWRTLRRKVLNYLDKISYFLGGGEGVGGLSKNRIPGERPRPSQCRSTVKYFFFILKHRFLIDFWECLNWKILSVCFLPIANLSYIFFTFWPLPPPLRCPFRSFWYAYFFSRTKIDYFMVNFVMAKNNKLFGLGQSRALVSFQHRELIFFLLTFYWP